MILRFLVPTLLIIPCIAIAQPKERQAAQRFLTDERFSKAAVSRTTLTLNSSGDDQVDGISPDGSKLVISRTPVRSGNSDLYVATRTGEAWSDPQKLGEDLNDSSNN